MIRVEPDERCLRGLTERLVLPAPVPLATLAALTRAVLGPQCVEAVEAWGERSVVRLVLQFRLEVRLGERDGVVTLYHRQLAPPSERARLREALLAALEDGLRSRAA